MIKPLGQILDDHRDAVEKTFVPEHVAVLEKVAKEILRAFRSGNKLLLCGNGGSAADSQHIAAEFIARFKLERRSLPAIALTTDSSILTALANDYNYEVVFARQVEGLGQKGDILIGISTSGNSKNVLLAMEKAKAQGLVTIAFTGRSGGQMKKFADICFCAQSDKTPHIQEMHITCLHAVSEVVEATLFGS
ncbi:MAG TPA: D-sedoheptulose 7-phosphate isomerase [Verrucomicrobiae bacterium]|jgi:D-sedoheptulose 7-phosphate isomerase|nr:D-sedoheptulose 7-phosphate isomerase [Verrucomicrobiae bacterium]